MGSRCLIKAHQTLLHCEQLVHLHTEDTVNTHTVFAVDSSITSIHLYLSKPVHTKSNHAAMFKELPAAGSPACSS